VRKEGTVQYRPQHTAPQDLWALVHRQSSSLRRSWSGNSFGKMIAGIFYLVLILFDCALSTRRTGPFYIIISQARRKRQRQYVSSDIRRERVQLDVAKSRAAGQDDKMEGPYVLCVRLSHGFNSNCASFQLGL
jgi:hypothetical protein